MNIADLALLIIWGFFFIRGYFRGLVKELGALAALICGFYLARSYQSWLSPHLAGYIAGNYTDVAAYILIFTFSMLGVWLLTLGLAGLVKIATAQWADRLFGGIFGLAKGLVISSAALFILTMLIPRPQFLAQSRLVPVLDKVAQTLSGYIPSDLHEKLNQLKSKSPI